MDSYEYYLSHHGIKGQKWGIRRFQEVDGTLTAEGRARYDVDLLGNKTRYDLAKKEVRQLTKSGIAYTSEAKLNKARAKKEFAKDQYRDAKAREQLNQRKNPPGKREQSLIEKYKKDGMTQEEAEVRAYRRARAEKIAAITAAVTVTAAASYVAYKHWDATADKFIKSGRTIQNISIDSAKDVNNAFYASYKNQDKSKFIGLFGGRHLAGTGKPVYSMNASVKDGGVKIAGGKNAKKILEDALSNNSAFRSDTKQRLQNLQNGTDSFGGFSGAAKAKLFEEHLNKGKLTKADYRFFNTMLVDHKGSQQKVTDQFYEALKKKGYDAVIDVNDKWQSGYNAKAPIIVFNGSEKLLKTSNTKLDPTVMQKGRAFWEKRLMTQQTVKAIAKDPRIMAYAAMFPASIISGSKAAKDNSKEVHKKMIAKYKKEHPNTTLSNNEILRNLYGYS